MTVRTLTLALSFRCSSPRRDCGRRCAGWKNNLRGLRSHLQSTLDTAPQLCLWQVEEPLLYTPFPTEGIAHQPRFWGPQVGSPHCPPPSQLRSCFWMEASHLPRPSLYTQRTHRNLPRKDAFKLKGRAERAGHSQFGVLQD
ncbi:hypothetical protein H1C71_032620 [Ictidomys tridecemlineatus]|nr:hypothetical protein H1C71_032620 [Ictidomys tridecemlineatus]